MDLLEVERDLREALQAEMILQEEVVPQEEDLLEEMVDPEVDPLETQEIPPETDRLRATREDKGRTRTRFRLNILSRIDNR